jgi:CRP/FNR family transcriptional regulator, cyclic AMP receptor protein
MDEKSKNAERLFERFGRKYEGGAVVFAEDDPAAEVFMVLDGRVRLTRRVQGVDRDIVVLKGGDVFGETALVRDQLRSESAVALGQCRVLAFATEEFEALLAGQPEVALKLIGQLIRRLQVAEERIENMMLRDAGSKIVNTLIRLARAAGPGQARVLLNISPIELSTRIGLDVDTVKRGILQLKENRFLGISGEQLELLDVDSLRKLYKLMGMKEDLRKE